MEEKKGKQETENKEKERKKERIQKAKVMGNMSDRSKSMHQ